MTKGKAEPDQQYLMRRLAQEEAAVRSAADPRARYSHLELARRYRDACGEPTGTEDMR